MFDFQFPLSRRQMLKSTSCGFGYLALAGLATEAAAEYQDPLMPRAPHFPPRAKSVIFLCMQGGPSHLDTFDYKPRLETDHGRSAPAPYGRPGRPLLRSPWRFRQHGESGLVISELFPHLARHADDLCVINSMRTDVPNHPQSFLMLHTGEFRFARPSMGSWILYGLGSENRNLPGYVTIRPPENVGGAQNYGSAFLPAAYQGTTIEGPIVNARFNNVTSRASNSVQRRQLDLLQGMNRDFARRQQGNTELEGLVDSFELGFRMQNSVPALMDLRSESRQTLEMYGIGPGRVTDDFGRQCLLARRFAEAGVRFVEVCKQGWDTHNRLAVRLPLLTRSTDQPIAALLTDLKQRGLSDETLVLWGGEFGRTPGGQGQDGRDHNAAGFTMWLAGAGVKGGLHFGATDEHGFAAVQDPVHHHDLHATLLHLLGLDHRRLTYRYGGRDYSLTDIHGRVVREIMS